MLRLLGDFDGAERAYVHAVQNGSDAQLGRALLSLSRGDVESAEATVHRMLEATHGAIFRHRLIPGCVEVLLTAERMDEAAALAKELTEIAEEFDSVAVQAAAGTVAAQVALARQDPDAALAAAQSALHYWLHLDAAYEVARSRVLIGCALQLVGDDDGADLELRTALAAFEGQGAVVDAHHVAELLGEVDRPGGLTPREIEVLSLVAAGSTNAQIASELHLSIKTVARHLSNIFTKLDVNSRTQAAALARQYGLA